MCYKISITDSADLVEKRYGAKFKPETNYKPYYHANGFAIPSLPVITSEHPDEIDLFQWSLVAHFARTDADAKKFRVGTLNAKSEEVFEKASFKQAIIQRRCLVPANSFYESRDHAGAKYPYRIHMADNSLFSFAGIYNYWKNEAGVWAGTFSIMTTVPNQMLSQIHNVALRMPVILPRDKEREWIRKDLIRDEIINLMQPLEDGVLQAHPVSKKINQTKEHTNEHWIQEVCEYPELPPLNIN